MSQVIITEDKLSDKRKYSRDQEHQIKVESHLARWRRNDITKPDPVRKILGLVAAPVLALWAGLAALVVAAMMLIRGCFRGLAAIMFGSKSTTVRSQRS